MTLADLVSLWTTGPGSKHVFSRPMEDRSRLGPEQRGQFRRKKNSVGCKEDEILQYS